MNLSNRELAQYRQAIEDEQSKELARRHERPPWRGALEDLCIDNYANPEFCRRCQRFWEPRQSAMRTWSWQASSTPSPAGFAGGPMHLRW